ncbi:Ribosomal silencing factor RsfS [invertebrate metagenome]|uniref:Ribosomal silencing factor RsfS n=1 Tax=invertebrate metagenome TaxID=1711999 RepID=A0A2H9T718_9ZZZZ
MNSSDLKTQLIDALEEMKGLDITVLDVKALTDITDYMVIVSGSSNRHVKSLAENVAKRGKEFELSSVRLEGMENAEWVLADLGDVVVHVMLPSTRQFYDLERLWSADAVTSAHEKA